jgi:integrase/recombinase XerD
MGSAAEAQNGGQMNTPVITIFVRHTPGCKWAGDEFCKRCNCRKHFRWSQDGKQYRKQAGTRTWAEAEENKRRLEARLTGQPVAEDLKRVEDAVKVFNADQVNEGWTAGVLGKYTRELTRLQGYCEGQEVYTVQGITRELLVGYQATWPELYPSTQTRQAVQARLRKFLRFCYDNRWLDRVPRTARIKVDEAPTLPLTAKEYTHLLETVPVSFPDAAKARKVRGLVQTMRWSGLAIRDVVTLRRTEIIHEKKLTRIVTARQKTGTHVSVPIPPDVSKEILAVANGNPEYIFWSTGTGKEQSAVTNWQHDLRQLFKDAGIKSAGNMLSHRLRDTFAVDLLEKGVPLEEVSKLLGHESIKTTEKHYSKWMKGRQDRLDKLVTDAWTK